MRKLASIQKINDIRPIEGADLIVCVTVLGWDLVAKKEEFEIGDLCVYFEIDSFLPIRPEYEFLRSSSFKRHPELGEGFRLRTVKLRGQLSQGLALPLSVFELDLADCVEGTDVTELLGVRKYEEPLTVDSGSGLQMREFPAFLPKTEEPRLQSEPGLLKEVTSREYYVTEKLDGASITVFVHGTSFGICSRNQEILLPQEVAEALTLSSSSDTWPSTGNVYVDTALRMKLHDFLARAASSFGGVALQGELIGPRVQGNHYGLDATTIRFYSVFFVDHNRFATLEELQEMSALYGFELVPMIQADANEVGNDASAMLKFADGNSALAPNKRREGIVVRTTENVQGEKLSFKVISNTYLLKQKG